MERYKKVKFIGRGAYGSVYLCHRISDHHLVIVKEIPIEQMSKDERQASLNEAKVLSMLDHPNIIAYYENFLEENTMIIVMEYAEGGTLCDYLQMRNGKLLNEEEVLYFFAQMVQAMQHIHSRQILHRDLKSQNILLNKNKTIVKIGDFGISKILSSKSKAYTVVGTPCYISPELCEGKPYNQKSDIWALGCVLYELLTLKRPFDANNLPALIMKIMKGSFDPIPNVYSEDLRRLLMSMLHLEPSRRPTVCQIIAQPFLINSLYRLYVNIGCLACTLEQQKCSSSSSLSQLGITACKRSSLEIDCQNSATSFISKNKCKVWFVESTAEHPILLPLQIGNLTVENISLGRNQNVGVTKSGSLIIWQPKTVSSERSAPSAVYFTASIIEETFATYIACVVCGDDFTVCLSDTGVVLTFGKGSSGCLGHGDEENISQPKIVEALFGFSIISVACGSQHVLAVSEDNNLFTWGCGNKGCLGLGNAESHIVPQLVKMPSDQKVTKVFGGVDCSFAVTKDKTLLACGSNRHNKLALDNEDGPELDEVWVFTPVRSEPLQQAKIALVATGISHTAVLTEDGVVYTVGSNRYGQLGWGQPGLTHSMPGIVDELRSNTVSHITCGDFFTVAVTNDASFLMWGKCPQLMQMAGNPSFRKIEEMVFLKGQKLASVACHSGNCLILSNIEEELPLKTGQVFQNLF